MLSAGPAHAAITPGESGTTPDDVSGQEVPVLGSVTMTADRKSGADQGVALVHGVRRIPGGTVLYWSGGTESGSDAAWNSFGNSRVDRYKGQFSSVSEPRLIDVPNRKVYAPLAVAGGPNGETTIASPNAALPDRNGGGGVFHTFYAVMPELPENLTSIDVQFASRDVVQNVPIETGVLEPAVPQDEKPLRMGEGWPEIDLAAVADPLRPEESVFTLRLTTSNLDGSLIEERTEKAVTVDVSSDVLFAVDAAELNPKAATVLQRAADSVSSAAAVSEIQIVGHTDSSGTDAHNQKLSQDRAQAVAEALKPLITLSDVEYRVSGRGASDPVAKNSTKEGRERNRRVSIVFGGPK